MYIHSNFSLLQQTQKQHKMYKAKLNELCQKTNWGHPVYIPMKDGPDHDPLYRASVVVNGSTFDSTSWFVKCKAACNDVAEIAYNHFLTFSEIAIEAMKRPPKKRKLSFMGETSDPKTVKEDVPDALFSISSSNLNTGDVDVINESCLPVLPSKATTQIAPSGHSALSNNEPVPKKSMVGYMLRNKAIKDMSESNSKEPVHRYMLRKRGNTSKGTVVLPIAKKK